MEPLKQLGAQLKNIWKQLGINQRVIVAAGGIGIFGGLIALAMWSSQPRYALLYGNLSLKDIDTLRNTLEGQSIPNKIGPNVTGRDHRGQYQKQPVTICLFH